jgi:uncharacterized protein (DUF1810 family)
VETWWEIPHRPTISEGWRAPASRDTIDATEEQDVTDQFDLDRFVVAQEVNYFDALAELRSGQKRSHWMWYVFPQIAGLGRSAMSERYGLHGEAEARAYLAHATLGHRLIECAEAILGIRNRSAREILGSPDDLKLRSCATLFARVSAAGSVFHRILDQYYNGEPDPQTIDRLRVSSSG